MVNMSGGNQMFLYFVVFNHLWLVFLFVSEKNRSAFRWVKQTIKLRTVFSFGNFFSIEMLDMMPI